MNQMEVGNGSGMNWEISPKFDNKKRQLPIKRNWRGEKAYYCVDLCRMIMPM
ncbi:hypothetical protein [Massilicoli timonensis]|uniref:hypothetical protein n=1 Tax=Massilicoli timonensis TaxID=2015901 RepID=UPI003AAF918A